MRCLKIYLRSTFNFHILNRKNEDEAGFDDSETRKLFGRFFSEYFYLTEKLINIGILELDMRDERSRKFINEANKKHTLFPDLRLLAFRYINEDNEDIKGIMTNCILKTQSLFFNNHVLPKYRLKKIDIGNYMESIINILPKVTKDVYFYYMKINGRQMAR